VSSEAILMVRFHPEIRRVHVLRART
jgi:hypothetical protein